MNTLFKNAALGTVLALSLGVSAQAAPVAVTNSQTTTVGLVSNNYSTTTGTLAGTFGDLFTFSVGPNIATGLAAQGIMVSTSGTSLSSISIYSGTFASYADLVDSARIAFSSTVTTNPLNIGLPVPVTTDNVALGMANLAANSPYTLVVNGSSTGGSSYSTIIQLAPVPEPETYAMLLAGLGVMGVVARRRQKKNIKG